MANELKFKISKTDIIKKLTNLRNELARKMGIETYKVLQNATIFEIADKMPQNNEELLNIKGIGEKKLAQFGDLILQKIHGEVQVKGQMDLDQIFTVSNFLDYINGILVKDAESFRIIGEISGINIHTSGTYFLLKDKKDVSVLNCWIPPHFYQMIGLELEDGMEIKVEGYPNIHKPKGRFSMVVQSFELAGEGSLKKAYELLKKKLESEGLFARKRILPENINKIGLITSRSGAAIDDFRKNLIDRGHQIKFYDVRVEGIKAVPEIIKAIKYFNEITVGLDVLIITRGGGSLEDLQAFNNERVGREIFASTIPTICAIGHERDVPIASMVGDVSVSTPTAAAVRINESWQKTEEFIEDFTQRLQYKFDEIINARKNRINFQAQQLINNFGKLLAKYEMYRDLIRLEFENIQSKILKNREKISEKKSQLMRLFDYKLKRNKEKINLWSKYLESNNPARNLKLGYSIAYNNAGKVIKSVKNLKIKQDIKVDLFDGSVKSKINKIIKN